MDKQPTKKEVHIDNNPKTERLMPQQISIENVEEKKKNKKTSLKFLHEKDRTLVTGKFINHELPGNSIDFCFRKYKWDRVERYKFEDGKIYKIPRGVALHLHNNCWYPVHEFRQDEFGKPHQEIGIKKKRFSFIPIDFEIDDEFKSHHPGSEIYTVRSIR